MFIDLMNANPVGSKLVKILHDPNYIAEIKWDGCRYEYQQEDFISKLGVSKGFNVPHLTNILKKYDVILDGEIFYPGTDSNAATKIMGCTLPRESQAKQCQYGPIDYMLYDILHVNGRELVLQPWKERRKYLDEFMHEKLANDDDWKAMQSQIQISPVFPDKLGCLTEEEIKKAIESMQLEGFMFKNVNAPYFPGKSPEGVWYKVKQEFSIDAIITGYTKGTGKYEGQIGSLIFSLFNDDGKLVECGKCSGFNDAIRLDMSRNWSKYEGRIIEVRSNKKLSDTSYRHPTFHSFREDKILSRCNMHQV